MVVNRKRKNNMIIFNLHARICMEGSIVLKWT